MGLAQDGSFGTPDLSGRSILRGGSGWEDGRMDLRFNIK